MFTFYHKEIQSSHGGTQSIAMNINTIKNHIEEILKENDRLNLKEIYVQIFSLIDYTSLNIIDNSEKIIKMVKQVNNFKNQFNQNVAAICVFPNFIETVKQNLADKEVNIASVSASFPFSQTFTAVKKLETEIAIASGADEIDIVMPIGYLSSSNDTMIVSEIRMIKEICGTHHLKVILETGLFNDPELIKTASELAIEGGADFIKTSTGKNGSIASYEAVYIMCDVISEHYKNYGKKVGIKPAGGISSTEDAINYYSIIYTLLGEKWINKSCFRIGASSLVKNIIQYL